MADFEEIGRLLRELFNLGHDTTDLRRGEMFVDLVRKGSEVLDGELGPDGQ